MRSSANLEPLKNWSNAVLPKLRSLPAETGRRYKDQDLLGHYFRVGSFLEDWTGNRSLAQAGFLHGLWDLTLLDQLPCVVSNETRQMLEDRKRLWAIDPTDPDVPERMTTNVLPFLKHAGAAILLIVEQLDHLDPEQAFQQFTREFQTRVAQVPVNLGAIPGAFLDLETQISYLGSVVRTTASFFGLWFYKNVLEDICLYSGNSDRFRELARFTAKPEIRNEIQKRTDLIRELLQGFPGVEIFWEWHHIASLDRRLPPETDSNVWGQRLSSCGAVTVQCKTEDQCYRVVARLHLDPAYSHKTDIEDYLGSPTPSGYEAFHTVLNCRTDVKSAVKSIPVRIITESSQAQRFHTIDSRKLEMMQKQLEARREKQLRVFAHDGQAILLPAGSTVLNFACRIHSALVTYAKGATVNRERVDLLHPLKEGDVVKIEVGGEPRRLPTGWKNKVPATTVFKLQKAFRTSFKPSLIKAGREYIRRKLEEHNIKGELDDDMLDSFLEEAIVETCKGDALRAGADASGWLRKFGLLEGNEKVSSRTSELLDRIVVITANRIKRSTKSELDAFTLPKNLSAKFDHLVFCEECRPTADQKIVGVVDGRTLIIHLARRKCGEKGVLIKWRRRYTRGQYFVIEKTNRQGIAAEILAVIAKHGVDIIDHHGTSLGPSWAVSRIHVHSIGPKMIEKIQHDLKQIDGVLRIIPPGQPPIPVLEAPLPPRDHFQARFPIRESPYLAGPPLPDDIYFYGRTRELGILLDEFKRAKSAGASAFVTGPRRYGKTSLVERFVRELQRTEYECTSVNLRAEPGKAWHDLAERLRDTLRSELAAFMVRSAESSDIRLEDMSLRELIDCFWHQFRRSLVIVIDEAISMFLSTAKEGRENDLTEFVGWLKDSTHVLLVWVGPEAPVSSLPASLIDLLASAHQIRVAPLNVMEVAQLLRAENHESWRLKIQLEDGVARSVWNFTRGNPFWCSFLAGRIFDAESSVDGLVRYRRDQLKDAKLMLARNGYAFIDRVEHLANHPELQEVASYILLTLARASKQSSTFEGVKTDELFHATKLSYANINPNSFQSILNEMYHRGSIQPERRGGEGTWRIEAPALADFILGTFLGYQSN